MFSAVTTGLNVLPLYTISKQAVQYLALPSLMADLYYEQKYVSVAHIASGVLPFLVAVTGNDNPHLSNFVLSVNIISLCYYAIKNTCDDYAWPTAGCALVTYFGLSYVNALFPLGLAITEFYAQKLYDENFGPRLSDKERKELERQKKEEEQKQKRAEKEAQKYAKQAAQKAKAKAKAREKECKRKWRKKVYLFVSFRICEVLKNTKMILESIKTISHWFIDAIGNI